MRLRTLLPFFALLFLSTGLYAQETIYAENFDNGCVLPAGWEVNINGYQDAVWYVDAGLHNNDENGLSMNGSCFLVVDDDETGDNTPAYVCSFITPAFDATQYPTVSLSVDVHYRDYGPSNESFKVLLTDGVTETELKTFSQGNSTGDSLQKYVTLKYDLSFFHPGPNMRIIFRYDDGGGYAWWAAIDNIKVVGSGQGVNVMKEAFNDCSKPADWSTEVLTGDNDWQFGYTINPKTTYAGASMDGTCMAFFDDDILGDSAAYSAVRLYSPWFDGTQYGNFELNFDVIMRYYQEKFALYVQHGDGSEYPVEETAADIGGPNFPDYVHKTIDISPFRSQQMRLIFQYDDGQNWDWWIGIDNVKVTGSGVANDICANAMPILTGNTCVTQSNRNAVFDGPLPACIEKPVASMWYSWQADFSGTAVVHTQADFNDVVNVFTGDCSNPQVQVCDNYDEHGFTGEATRFPVTLGQQYFLRVCGREGGFGASRGNLCVRIEQENTTPATPANDLCNNAIPLTIDAPCVNGNNLHAATDAPQPSLNELARADIWYQFTAPVLAPGEALEFRSNADFSDIITLYEGDCNNLTEVEGNHKGARLLLDQVQAGHAYFIQVSGNFATVQGNLCAQVVKFQENAPTNDLCVNAAELTLDAACQSASNVGAGFSGRIPPCVPVLAHDIWFKFTAPASGSVRINTNADFPHVLAVWQGDCDSMTAVLCAENPLRCDGFLTVGSLQAGQVYFIQIGSIASAGSYESGSVCIRILDGNTAPDFMPMSFQVDEKCVDVDMASLKFKLSGGIPPYTFEGNSDGEVLPSGSQFFVVATDAMGCVRSFTGIVDECAGSACTVAGTVETVQPKCHDSNDGSILAMVSGGIGPYTFSWSNDSSSAGITGLAPGTYSVTITDALDCYTEQSATIVAPAALVIAPATIIQPGQGQSNGAVDMDVAGGTAPYTYQWLRNDSLYISGVEDLNGVPSGAYELQVTDANGCAQSFKVTLTESVGTKDVAENSFAEIFPNPAREKATLAVSFPRARDLFLSLHDASGRVLQSWTDSNVTEKNIPLNIRELPSGSYQVRIVTDVETITEQLIVR